MEHDPLARQLFKLAESGQTQRFWLEDGLLLYTKGQRVYVHKWNNLRKTIIRECHDTPWAGHSGQRWTYALVEASYYWPQMKDKVKAYMKTCLVCQQDKVKNQLPARLLDPLPIPAHPWESVSMDFITCLPRSDGCGSIMVVVDRVSKYATFVASPADCTAEETAQLFLKNVVKYWGLPKVIVSDRDPRFTGKFWTELFKLPGSELHFSTSFHPQTDGRNGLLKPHYDDKEDPSRGESHRAPTAVVKSYDKEVEYVLSNRLERRRGVPPTRHYLVKWKGLPEREAT
ncbi:hypothetical protein RJ640_028505 [Escallonia rubra]|uniref:Uncharacterized protein n=1 Tax=Escallonia rubra TaxID=112253 RepID=A0AA88U2J6_9ASTE|nr:hypothetical protein RJ640_028505 [Escallonia rubra]